MHINSIATSSEPGVRFVRKVKPYYVEHGWFNPGEDKPHEVNTPRMARILLSAHNPRKGEQDWEGNRLRQLLDLFDGKTVSTFYADYQIHPDDADKAVAVRAKYAA
jgi:hypothetical protein